MFDLDTVVYAQHARADREVMIVLHLLKSEIVMRLYVQIVFKSERYSFLIRTIEGLLTYPSC